MPTTIHVALEDALSGAVIQCQLPPSEEKDTELDLLSPSSVFELLSTEEWRSDPHTPGEASQRRFVTPGEVPSPTPSPDQGFPSDRSSFGDGDGNSIGDGTARPRLSAGRCVTRAIEAASYRLSSYPAAAASPPASAAATANGGGGDFMGGSAIDGSSQQQQRQQQEALEESAHIVNLIWSKGAEAYLDSITQLVADVLKSLDNEVSRDVQAAAAVARGDGDKSREAKPGEEEVSKDSKAGLLLARVLSLGLEKQDVEEDGGGGEAGEAAACPLVRELYERLGSFSSTHEKLDAVKTLLLAACYFEGVRAASTGVSRG